MSDTFLGYLLAGISLLLFTTGILVTKLASSRIHLSLGFLIATSTNVVFAGLAFAVQNILRPDSLHWNAQAFWLFVAAGGFATYLGRWFFYEAVVRFGPAKASVFQVSSPLFTALIAWLVLGERLSLLVAGGMVLTIGGLMLVSYKPGFFTRSSAAGSTTVLVKSGDVKVLNTLQQRLLASVLVLGLGSSLAYAVGNVLRGSAVRSWPEPILGALVGAVFGLALHLAFTPGKRELLARLRVANRSGVWLYALMGVTTISGQICTIGSMRYIPLSIATLITLCTPLLVFPLSYLLFKNSDDLKLTTWLGCALTLAGIFIIAMR